MVLAMRKVWRLLKGTVWRAWLSAAMLIGGACLIVLAAHMHVMHETGMYDSPPPPCGTVGVALIVGGVVLLSCWPKRPPCHKRNTRLR